MPLGPSPSYLAKYNNYTLPGYVQQEKFESLLNIADHYGAYIDGSQSEDTGLSNKMLSMRLKVWETDYATVKDQIRLAATMLRSKRVFAPLYIQNSDTHYMALVKGVTMDKEVGSSVRIGEYNVDFECKPWLYGEVQHTLTGTGTIDTDQVSRTIDNGTWTPTIITLTGTDVTVSGYTDAGDFTGFISVTGSVTNLIVDTEAFTAEISGVNQNSIMASIDYRMYVGPAKTNFVITGASSCTIDYYDRWNL